MGVSVRWLDDEKTILCYTYAGRWTWPEYEIAAAQAAALAKEAGPHLDVIADFTDGSLLPDAALSNFRKSLHKSEQTVPFEMTVLILKSEFMLRMFHLFGKLYGRGLIGSKLKSADSLDQALKLIVQRRAASK